jgi:hypothetical protein
MAAAAGVDSAERRRGQGGEDQRMGGDRLGDGLSASDAGAEEAEHVRGIYRREQDGHSEARRFPQRTGWAQFPTRDKVSAKAPKSFDSSRSSTCW